MWFDRITNEFSRCYDFWSIFDQIAEKNDLCLFYDFAVKINFRVVVGYVLEASGGTFFDLGILALSVFLDIPSTLAASDRLPSVFSTTCNMY